MLGRMLETLLDIVAWTLHQFGIPELQNYLDCRPSQTLRFHRCRGQVVLSENEGIVSRLDRNGFKDGIAFSHRPIEPCEKVSLQILKTTRKFVGPLAIGFTCLNPQDLEMADLRRIKACSRHPIGGVWIKTLLLHDMEPGLRIDFQFDTVGTMSYAVDGAKQDDEMVGLAYDGPLWAVFDVYGSVRSIMLVRGSGESTSEPLPVNNNQHVANQGSGNWEHPLRLPTPMFPFSIPPEDSGTTPPWTSLVFYSNFYSDSPLQQPHQPGVEPLPLFRRRRGYSGPNLSLNLGYGASIERKSPMGNYNSGKCVICLQNDTTMTVHDCGHLCMCKGCSESFEQMSPRTAFSWDGVPRFPCPICRHPVTKIGVI